MPQHWVKHELSKEEIFALTETVKEKIEVDHAVQLLPYHGLLYFKDKIWEGHVFCLQRNAEEFKDAGAVSNRSCFYLLEVTPKIVNTAQNPNSIETALSIFDSFGGTDNYPYTAAEEQEFHEMLEYVVSDRVEATEIYADNDLCAIRPCGFCYLESYLLGKSFKFVLKATAFFAVLESSSERFQATSRTVDGYDIRKMTLEETRYAVERWKFSSASTIERFLNSAKLGLAFGAFPIGSDTPVSWAMTSWDGAIAALQTLPDHRGKGLAKAVIKTISTEMTKRNLIPFVFIEDVETSVIPVSLFSSLGFTCFKDIKFCWGRSIQSNQ